MRYNLEFRKLTFYGLTRPQSIRKSKQISGQTILSSPQDVEFNPNFAKNRDIPVVKNSVTRPVTPAVLTTDTLSTFYSTLITCQIPAYNPVENITQNNQVLENLVFRDIQCNVRHKHIQFLWPVKVERFPNIDHISCMRLKKKVKSGLKLLKEFVICWIYMYMGVFLKRRPKT